MAVAVVGALRVGDGVRRTETRQHVDMRVGVVTLEFSVIEPEHPLYAQFLGKKPFKDRLVITRITAVCDQAVRGGQQAALAVGIDAAALEHQPEMPTGGAEHSCGFQLPRDFIIQCGGVFVSPAVEGKIQ